MAGFPASSWPTTHVQPSNPTVVVQHAPTTTDTARTTIRRGKPPRTLDSEKCRLCRQHKVKCSPQPRIWPQKCDRCSRMGHECSPGEVKSRIRRQARQASCTVPAAETTHQETNRAPLPPATMDANFETTRDDSRVDRDTWDSEDLTNMVTTVQLLNSQLVFMTELSVTLRGLVSGSFNSHGNYFATRKTELLELTEWLKEKLRLSMHQRLESISPVSAEAILIQKAASDLELGLHIPEALPVSMNNLKRLPIGTRLCFQLRYLHSRTGFWGRVSQSHIWCNFEPLLRLVRMLEGELPSLMVRFYLPGYSNLKVMREVLHGPILLSAAVGLVLANSKTSGSQGFCFVQHWICDLISRADSTNIVFPVDEFASEWEADMPNLESIARIGIIKINAVDMEGHSLLHIAILCGKPRLVKALLKHGLNARCQITSGKFTPFHYAAALGDTKSYERMLDCEPIEPLEPLADAWGFLPLHIAARNGHTVLVEEILSCYHIGDHEYINSRTTSRQTALMLAIEADHLDTVEYLVSYRGSDLSLIDSYGQLPLHLACQEDDMFCLVLSKSSRQAINVQDCLGRTPLHLMMENAGTTMMQAILGMHSIEPDLEDSVEGSTPLQLAVFHGNVEAVKLLGIRRDVDVSRLSGICIEQLRKQSKYSDRHTHIRHWLRKHCKELATELNGEDPRIKRGEVEVIDLSVDYET